MKQQIQRIIEFFPGGKTILWYYVSGRRRIRAARIQAVFTKIYKENSWGSAESVSGPGSTVEYTKNIVKEIPLLISRLGVKRVLDAPCGDYNWFRLIERGDNVSYLGGDIVEALVVSNQKKYGNVNTRFIHLDITKDKLPVADLWLCRDCLRHQSNDDVFKVVDNFLNSDIRYLLTSSYVECKMNIDILTGQGRELNLELPPFSFCKPLMTIDDWIQGFPRRHLALWEKNQLSQSLISNKLFQQYRSNKCRLYLSRKYVFGNGLEIGAAATPLRVFNHARVLYVDRKTVEGLRSDFPKLANSLAYVDIVDDGEHLETIRGNSVDFVIANHVLEHYEDPIMAIRTAVRVLRPSGVLFLAVPDKRYMYDRDRDVTSLEHLIRDYCDGPMVSREDHFRDAFDKTYYSPTDFEECLAPYKDKAYKGKEMKPGIIHYHVWTDKEIVELLSYMEKEMGLGISILKVVNAGFENIFIVKKVLPS
jgi:SAM-dependent methyltransferase